MKTIYIKLTLILIICSIAICFKLPSVSDDNFDQYSEIQKLRATPGSYMKKYHGLEYYHAKCKYYKTYECPEPGCPAWDQCHWDGFQSFGDHACFRIRKEKVIHLLHAPECKFVYDDKNYYKHITFYKRIGCKDVNALNFDPMAIEADNLVCQYSWGCMNPNAKNYNPIAQRDDGSCLYWKYGCTDAGAKNFDPTAEKNDPSKCQYWKVGCMDPTAKNYDPTAEKPDDGNPCQFWKKGCMDPKAKNYDPTAEKPDDDPNKPCLFWKKGCMDPTAKNYDPTAEKPDDDPNKSCQFWKKGCMDPTAKNYDPTAEKPDNTSCVYSIFRLDKYIIFALDTSGSMDGNKLTMLKKEVIKLLDQIDEKNSFSIMSFNDKFTYIPFKEGTNENVLSAKQYVDQLKANGGTTIMPIFMAFKDIITSPKYDFQTDNLNFYIITDGDPTDNTSLLNTFFTDQIDKAHKN